MSPTAKFCWGLVLCIELTVVYIVWSIVCDYLRARRTLQPGESLERTIFLGPVQLTYRIARET